MTRIGAIADFLQDIGQLHKLPSCAIFSYNVIRARRCLTRASMGSAEFLKGIELT